MQGYTETIRRWAVDDRRTGILADADGTGEVGLAAAEAGRQLAVRFTLKLASGLVADIRYQVFGCGFTMAACAAAIGVWPKCCRRGRPWGFSRGSTSNRS